MSHAFADLNSLLGIWLGGKRRGGDGGKDKKLHRDHWREAVALRREILRREDLDAEILLLLALDEECL